jgi:replicative DNA helicase
MKNKDPREMTKKELSDKIRELRFKISETTDFDERLKLEKQRADLIDIFYEMVTEERTKRPTFSAAEFLNKRPPVLEFFQTGIKTIDENLGGLIKGGFVQVAAASGVGKTTMMVKLMANLARIEKVVHFDFEMGEYKLFFLLDRFLKTKEQRNNYFINFESFKLNDLVKEITYLNEQGVSLFLIDSKMKIETDVKDVYKSASLISHELSKLTKSGNMTIILINQMSDAAIREGRAELKGSGDQVYDSDVILVLTKVKDKERSSKDETVLYEDRRGIMCVKNRFGPLFKGEIFKDEIFEDSAPKPVQEVEIQMEDIPV